MELTEEQEMLQQSLGGLLENEFPISRLREIFDGDTGHDPDLWKSLIELGIAGGTQMTFESAMASKEEAAQPRQPRGVKRSDGKAEAKRREDAAIAKAAEREQVKMARKNDEASVAAAKERYLARKAAAAAQ